MLWYLVIDEPCFDEPYFDKGGFLWLIFYIFYRFTHYLDCRSMNRMCYLDPTINTNNVHFYNEEGIL